MLKPEESQEKNTDKGEWTNEKEIGKETVEKENRKINQ